MNQPYQSKKKKQYMKYLETSSSSSVEKAQTVFAFFAPLEREKGKDLADISAERIHAYLNEAVCLDRYSAKNYMNLVNRYLAWCEQNGFPVRGNRLKPSVIAPDIGKKAEEMKKALFPSAEEMLAELVNLFSMETGSSLIPLMCFVWLGVSGKAAMDLRRDEVDLEGQAIAGHETQLAPAADRAIWDALRQYDRLSSIDSTADTQIGRKRNMGKEERADLFIRFHGFINGLWVEPMTYDSCLTYMTKVRRDYNERGLGTELRLNLTSVKKSGAFARLYQLEQSGECLEKNAALVKKCYGAKQIVAKDILFQYKAYKMAFDL